MIFCKEQRLYPLGVTIRQIQFYRRYGLGNVYHFVHAQIDSAMQGDDALQFLFEIASMPVALA